MPLNVTSAAPGRESLQVPTCKDIAAILNAFAMRLKRRAAPRSSLQKPFRFSRLSGW